MNNIMFLFKTNTVKMLRNVLIRNSKIYIMTNLIGSEAIMIVIAYNILLYVKAPLMLSILGHLELNKIKYKQLKAEKKISLDDRL